MKKKLLMIVNPKAGKTRSRAPFYEAIADFCAAGYLIDLQQTGGRGDASELAKTAGEYDLVVCCGGDGTLNETVSGLLKLDRRPPLGYIPCGSTNDFAASLHLPLNPHAAAQHILSSPPRSLDVGIMNSRHFMYVASFGAFTSASYTAAQAVKNDLGHLAYIIEGMKSMSTLRPYQARVVADGEVIEGRFLFGAVCNATSIGGLMHISEEKVIVDDGKFEMLLIPEPRTTSDLQNLLMALLRQEYDSGGLILRHAAHVTLDTEEKLPWSLDGEFSPGGNHIEIHILPQLLEMQL